MAGKTGTEKAYELLKRLPRVQFNNINDPFLWQKINRNRGRDRGQHGGKTHGCGHKGSLARQGYLRAGYESSTSPFYLKFRKEYPYKDHHKKRQYPPLTLLKIQLLIDTGRLDPTEPIDLTSICNTGLFMINPLKRHFGFQILDQDMDQFAAKINLEVQWTTEPVIAAVERCGGTITTAYYDMASLMALCQPATFFQKGLPIPRRLPPPQDAIEYYTDPKNRGYLADPALVAQERLKLAQKYGYTLPDLSEDPQREMLTRRKDLSQVFYGLKPGWVVNLKDKVILKPTSQEVMDFFHS